MKKFNPQVMEMHIKLKNKKTDYYVKPIFEKVLDHSHHKKYIRYIDKKLSFNKPFNSDYYFFIKILNNCKIDSRDLKNDNPMATIVI